MILSGLMKGEKQMRMKKWAALLTALCLVCGACFSANAETAYSVTGKDTKMYIGSVDNSRDIQLFYVNGGNIPYIRVEDVGMLVETAYSLLPLAAPFYGLEYKAGGDHAVYTRGNYTMDFDFTNDTITFSDFDAFFKADNVGLVDLVWTSENTDALFRMSGLTTERYGKELVFDLKPYEIDLVAAGGSYYVPLQTVSDIACSYYECPAYYNGDAVFLTEGMDDAMKAVFQAGSLGWSEDLAAFSYHELCFALDYQYGLKDIHGITGFDELFSETGLKEGFLNTDATKADKALYRLIYFFLGDQHSALNSLSPLTDREAMLDVLDLGQGLSNNKTARAQLDFHTARDKAYPDGIPAYEEIGNTAYITFDQFMDFAPDLDYMAPVTEADNSKNETVRLMQYACSQILREGSPIQNVVMDLSCNGGGNTGAAEYVMATFLGEADFSIKNTMTGALTDSVYTIDTNLDGVFDEKDTLAGKGLNLFCITSPLSFSCGNLVPCVFKSSQKVTLLGQTSGGGSCSVHCFTTVYGSSFQVSGFRRFSVMKNGSFYDIDLGADPDYYIARPEKFYTREALTEFINGLY
jgi:hypothetical protein